MKKPSILIVEDEGLIALSLMQLMQRSGYNVLDPVASGEDALESLGKPPFPDLILMDIALAGKIDGLETARNIRQSSDVPIIFISAHSDEDRVARAAETKPAGFIVKPYNEREALALVEKALYP